MKLKLDANGNAVLQDGKPVYLKDDGSEVAFDAASTVATISRLNGEAKGHRERAETAEGKLKGFDGLDGEAARKALETVKNFDNKKLIDAGEAEKVRAEVAKGYEIKLSDAAKSNETLQQQLYAEKIGGAFARSKFIANELAVPSDMIQSTFQKHFSLKDGQTIATGADGNTIYSPSRPGEPANFEEAISLLVASYPHRDNIMKGRGASGSGSQGNGSGGKPGQKSYSQDQFNALRPKERAEAMAAGATIDA